MEVRQNTVDLQTHKTEPQQLPIRPIDCQETLEREKNFCSQANIQMIRSMEVEPNHQEYNRNSQHQ